MSGLFAVIHETVYNSICSLLGKFFIITNTFTLQFNFKSDNNIYIYIYIYIY